MRVLIVGGGGREHAIAWKVSQSPLLSKLYCCPGNAGTAEVAENISISTSNLGALALWAVEQGIDLTIVGPEAPLADGLVDVFAEHGLKVFGPVKAGARLESSKAFAKSVMQKVGIPTAKSETFEDFESAKKYVESEGAPIVIKADGLAAGKGVAVCQTMAEAIEALKGTMLEDSFGESGRKVVVEEFLEGREASLMAVVDSQTVLPLVISQDFKRLLDEDKGPNTGGMGAISPTPVLPDDQISGLVESVMLPVLRELHARGISYTGFLYAGLMIEPSGGVKVLEFNCRLGDPETQVILPRLNSDLLAVLKAATEGKLSTVELQWKKDAAACVVAASGGYPQQVDDGKAIAGIFENREDVFVFQAGTKSGESGEVITKGGRVLVVSALGETAKEAVDKAYSGLSGIAFDGMQYRKDIGKRAIEELETRSK